MMTPSSLVVAQHAAPFLSLVALTMLLPGCAVRRVTKDYVFSVTGTVKTQNDLGLQDADVTLEVNGPVYEAVDLVKTRHVLTSDKGWFVFAYISHEFAVKYTITVRKEGFESQTVSGTAPPNGNHVIRLKSLGEPTKGDLGGGPISSDRSLHTDHCSLSFHD